MIEIITEKGIKYTFDPNTQRLFRDQTFIPKTEIEPIYSGNNDDGQPELAGLYLKTKGTIITRNGIEKKLTPIDSIK